MWKANWSETKQRFQNWWAHEGLLIGMWGAPEVGRAVHDDAPAALRPATLEARYCDPAWRVAENHHRLSRSVFPFDVLPLASTDIGPGTLAALLGSEPGFAEDTVWFHPVFENIEEPETLPPLRFDAGNPLWQVTEAILRASVAASRGRYIVGCPDLIENMDILAALRGAQTLCLDLLERPEWVERKLAELNRVWCEVYQRIYDIIRLDDGSSAYGAFYLWGSGRTAKVQCDTSVMFSPQMFRRFVVPQLTAQCAWLDHAMYHLDGTQAMIHLEALLAIEPLDAIEWTPQAGIETGGHPRWFELYRRILAAGKSVQIVNVELHEIRPLLDAIGPKGVYLLIQLKTEREIEQAAKLVEPYYP